MSAGPYRKGAKAYRGLDLGQAIPVTYGGELDSNGQPEGPRPARKGLIGRSAQAKGDLSPQREKAYRRRYGDLNLGIHLRRGVASLDVDDADELRSWLKVQGYTLPPTPFSTARGADSTRRQLVYRVPKGWESNGLLPAGGEVIDAGHRYVRAWPSIHKSGSRYEWYFPSSDAFSTGRLLDSPPSRSELAELPEDVARALTALAEGREGRITGTREKDIDAWIESLDAGKAPERLRRLVNAIPTEGADNNGLMDLFGPLVRGAWESKGGRWAIEEGVRRYSEGYGPDAEREAMHAIGRAVGDYRAEIEARAAAVTFPIGRIAETVREPRGKKSKSGKGKKSKRGKAADAAPKPDPDYVVAKVETATDDALRAEYAAHELRERLLFIGGAQPRIRQGHRWVEIHESAAREIVREWHVNLAREMVGTRPKDAAKVLTSGSIDATLKLVRGLLSRAVVEFDSSPYLLNCPNGVVDLRTGKLRDHEAGDLFLKETAVPYKPKARSREHLAALEAMPPAVRKWMQLRLGRALVGMPPPDDRALFLQGIGSNGKTTIMDGCTVAVGDYAAVVSPKVLTSKDGDHSTESMDLLGSRMAVLEELPGGKHLSADHLKRVVGTRSLTARRMRQDPVTFAVTWSLVISTNHDITMVDTDDGAWRRMWVVPFPYAYVADPIHPHERLGDAAVRDAARGGDPSWLAWLVEGARMALADPEAYRDAPEEVRMRTVAIRSENDTMTQFLAECAEFVDDGWTSNVALGTAYNAWMHHRGFAECNVNTALSRFRASELSRGTETNVQRRVEGQPAKGVLGVRVSMPIVRIAL